MKGGGLLTYLYHSIDDANGTYGDNWFNKVTIDSLKKQLDTLVSVKDKIWITTFAQAIKYHRENKCASLTEIQPSNGSQWIINLTDTLDNAIYNQPLSIKLKRSGINYNRITQGNSILKIDSVLNDTIMFHAVPDAGPIILEANVMGIIENESLLNDIFIQPIPCNESLTIYSKKSLPNCQISIIDMTGKEITTIKQDIENSIQLDLSSLKKGIYLIRIDQNEYNIIKRIILN
jgi:chitin deacetylase